MGHLEYIGDWDESKHGPFPVKSRRHSNCRQVRLSGPKGIYAGYCIREPREIGGLKEIKDLRLIEEEFEVSVTEHSQDEDGGSVETVKTVKRKRMRQPNSEEIANAPVLEVVDTRKTVAARYRAIAIVEPSDEQKARQEKETELVTAFRAKAQQRHNASEAIKSKRENGQPLTAEDVGVIADLVTGREI